MNGKQLQAAYSTRIMKENVQWIQKGLFFTTILFLCQYRLQPHTPWKYTIFCQKKNGYTEWLQYTASHHAISNKKRMVTLNGSNIQLLTMLSAKPGKQKKIIQRHVWILGIWNRFLKI
jgi:hypothetical protein